MSDLIHQQRNLPAGLSPRETRICQIMHTFNQLRPFKLDDVEKLEWKDSILRIMPDVDLGALEFAVDRLLTGEVSYDKTEGIQNIFRALRRVKKIGEGQYELLNPTW